MVGKIAPNWVGRHMSFPGFVVGLALTLLSGAAPVALARPQAAGETGALVVDLSDHRVDITTGFSGAKVLLFGAVEGEGDIVVTLQGPVEGQTVRRRERILGVWVNRASATFTAPSFYRLASTRPVEQIASRGVLERNGIGLDHLTMAMRSRDGTVPDADYRAAFFRLKERDALYDGAARPVALIGGRLFRTELRLPANVPSGAYDVTVYLIRQGEVVSRQTTPLFIGKSGASAEIFDFANHQAALYGFVAVLVAAGAGWLAAAAFRRT